MTDRLDEIKKRHENEQASGVVALDKLWKDKAWLIAEVERLQGLLVNGLAEDMRHEVATMATDRLFEEMDEKIEATSND